MTRLTEVVQTNIVDITPQLMRHYLTISYFSPAIANSFMLWGPPGVGKSTSVEQAVHDISKVLSYVVSSIFHFLTGSRLENSAKIDVSKGLFAIALGNGYPVVTENEVKFYVTLRCREEKFRDEFCEDVGNESIGIYEFKDLLEKLRKAIEDVSFRGVVIKEMQMAYGQADTVTKNRVNELRDSINELLMSRRIDLEKVRKEFGTTMYPLFIPTSEIEHIDYQGIIFVSSLPEGGECVKRQGQTCIRARGLKFLYSLISDDEMVTYVYDKLSTMKAVGLTYTEYVNTLRRIVESGTDVAHIFFHFIDIRLSQLELDDIKGLPSDIIARVETVERGVENAKKARVLWVAPAWLVQRGFGVIFFDEINQAPPHVQGAAYMLILDKKVTTGHKMSPNVMVAAAGNQPRFAPEVARDLALPLRDRLKPMFNMSVYIYPENPKILRTIVDYNFRSSTSLDFAKTSFLSYIKERGYELSTSVEAVATSSMNLVDIRLTEQDRRLLPITPRGSEFFVRAVGNRTPTQLAALQSAIGNVRYMWPITYLIYTFFGLFGYDESDTTYRELFSNFMLHWLGVMSTVSFVDLLASEPSQFSAYLGSFRTLSSMIDEVLSEFGTQGGISALAERYNEIMPFIGQFIYKKYLKSKRNIEDNIKEMGVEYECKKGEKVTRAIIKKVKEEYKDIFNKFKFVIELIASQMCAEEERKERKTVRHRKESVID